MEGSRQRSAASENTHAIVSHVRASSRWLTAQFSAKGRRGGWSRAPQFFLGCLFVPRGRTTGFFGGAMRRFSVLAAALLGAHALAQCLHQVHDV